MVTQHQNLISDPLGLLFDRASTLAARARDGGLPFIDAVDMTYNADDPKADIRRPRRLNTKDF